MRIAWDSVGDIVVRVVADHLDETRLTKLVLIGVDEIAYRRGTGTPSLGRQSRQCLIVQALRALARRARSASRGNQLRADAPNPARRIAGRGRRLRDRC